jgi:DNA repair exonuclease SbcCD nuclease subunit
MKSKKLICLLGDVHGRFVFLKAKIINANLRDCYLICVGDLGIGFDSPEQESKNIQGLNSFFAKRNIDFLSIRGNHDDPKPFADNFKLSNFELLTDYTLRVINNERFLFAGGAHSIDRYSRQTEGGGWWADEAFVLKPELIQDCDVLITHSAPSWLFPSPLPLHFIPKPDITLREDCADEKNNIDKLLSQCNASHIYTGHFHESIAFDYNGYGEDRWCQGRILAELELKEHQK